MAHDRSQQIWSLSDQQALDACVALTTALELETEGLDTSNFDKLLAAGGQSERTLHQDLKAANISESETAAAARTMLLLAADLGYADQVGVAIDAATEHGRDFGVISGPLLLAGLAVVLSYVPVEERRKVKKIRYRAADGTVVEEDITETETIRVGAAAVEKLASWWKAMVGG